MTTYGSVGPSASVMHVLADLGERQADSSAQNADWDLSGAPAAQQSNDPNDLPKQQAERASQARSQRLVSGQDLGSIRMHELTSQQVAALDPMMAADAIALSIRDLTSSAMASSDRFVAQSNIEIARSNQISDLAPVYAGFDRAVENAVGAELSIFGQIEQLSTAAASETDPRKLAEIMRKVERLRTALNEVLKEKEKAEGMRELLHQLMFGSCDPGLVHKLRAMGLGDLVERLVRRMLPMIKKMHGGSLPLGMVIGLAAAGLGHLVQTELAQIRNALEQQRRILALQPQTIAEFIAIDQAWQTGQLSATSTPSAPFGAITQGQLLQSAIIGANASAAGAARIA